jgi:hypothetical protein
MSSRGGFARPRRVRLRHDLEITRGRQGRAHAHAKNFGTVDQE